MMVTSTLHAVPIPSRASCQLGYG